VPSKPSCYHVIKLDGRQAVLLSSLGSDLLSLCNEPSLSLTLNPVLQVSATGVRAPLPEDGGWFLESDFRAVLFHCWDMSPL